MNNSNIVNTVNTSLVALLLNARSINNKLGEIKMMIYCAKPEIVCFNETWLDKHTPTFVNYRAEWKSRIGIGGGVGVLIRSDIYYSLVTLTQYVNGVLEVIALKLYLKGQKELHVLVFYNSSGAVTAEELEHYVRQLGEIYIIMGDLNAHSPLLCTRTKYSDRNGKALEKILVNTDTCLINPLDFYTYLNPATGRLSCLDICLTSAQIAPSTAMDLHTDVGSDHRTVRITVELAIQKSNLIGNKRWKTTKEKLANFKQCIATCDLTQPMSMEEMNNNIVQRINNCAKRIIGQTSGKQRIGRKTPWWNRACQKAVTERRKARRVLEKYPTLENVATYKEKSRKVQEICKKAKAESFHKYIETITYDTPVKMIWKKIKAIKSTYTRGNFPIINDGKIIADGKEKANAIGKFLTANGKCNHKLIIDKTDKEIGEAFQNKDQELYNTEITEMEIIEAIQIAKETTAGEDQVTNTLLKNLPSSIIRELQSLYNQSFATGVVPESWKHSTVIPILKPEKPREELTSYRPISLLSCVGKTMERVLQRRLEYVAETRQSLKPNQYGFRRGYSTIDVLRKVEHNIRQALGSNEMTLVIYIDLKSAFDKVWPEGLIYKLIQLGIRGNLLNWIYSYLQDRKFKVRIDGETSDEFPLNTGVQQGAVLSPLLFNIMLSDLPVMEEVELLVYADDITIVSTGKETRNVKKLIENYLKLFDQWAKLWGLEINLKKTYMQHYTAKRSKPPIVRMNNNIIKYKKEHMLLGLNLDSPRLTWRPHIRYLISDCTRRMDLLKCIASTTWGASTKILKNFYMAYIRAKIDYGATLYGGGAETELRRLETLQNKCIRLILGARRSTPILSLQAEAFIPPLTLHREFLHVKEYIKCCYKPQSYITSLAVGTESLKTREVPFNSFSYRVKKSQLLPSMNCIKRIPTQIACKPPWLDLSQHIVETYDEVEVYNSATLEHYLEENYHGFVTLYSDGSKINDKDMTSTACAIYIPKRKQVISYRLRAEHSVVSSELFAICEALTYIKDRHCLYDYIIFTDSLSSLKMIKTNNTATAYINLVNKIQILLLQLNDNRRVILHWIRGHNQIKGNEIADQAAKKGHSNNKSVWFDLTQEEEISSLKKRYIKYWNECWAFNTNISAKGLFLRNLKDSLTPDDISYKLKNRRFEVVLHRLRMGHVGLKQYLHRFGMSESNLCDECNVPETVEHYLLHCGKYKEEQRIMKQELASINIDCSLKNILGCNGKYEKQNLMILQNTMKYIKATNKLDLL